MSELTGKCHCGKNKFTVSGNPQFQFICYCKDCRVLNGGGHLCGIVFDKNQISEAKETQTYSYQGGSGNPIIMHFCPTCSTQLYAYPTGSKGKVVVRANNLENADFKPQKAIFTESAFPWDKPIV